MPIELLERRFKIRGSFTFSRVSGRASRFIRIPMKSRLIRVEARFKNVKETWYRAGYLNHIHNGIISKGIVIKFGIQLIVMPDSLPYTLEFSPISWLPDGYLRISEYLLPLSNEELIQISLNSSNPPSLSILSTLLTMANTDIRSFKKMVSDLSAQVSDQALEIATTGAKVVSMEATMVIENTFSVLKAAFVLSDDVWFYDLTHDMNTLTPDVSIYDTNPTTGKAADLQLIQTTALTPIALRIELNADEYEGNNFPLEVVIQARNSTPVIGWQLMPGGEASYRLRSGKVEKTSDNGVSVTELFVNVVTAFVSANSRVYAYLQNEESFYIAEGTTNMVPVTLSDYSDAKMLPTSIDLIDTNQSAL